MAAEFLASHGIDLDNELARALNASGLQDTASSSGAIDDYTPPAPQPIRVLENIITGYYKTPQRFEIGEDGQIASIAPEPLTDTSVSALPRLVLPSLAHPHIHLDKPFLLSHQDTSHLAPKSGNFEEALSLTAQAKPLYTAEALLARGAQLLAESSRAGVTHLRGFCEVDTSVDLKCIEAGLKLKKAWESCLYVQVAAFAQDPLFSTKPDGTGKASDEADKAYCRDGNENLSLLEQSLRMSGVEVLATTPYVEASSRASQRNVNWAIDNAIKHNLHLDLHLDYNVDQDQEPLVWYVLGQLRRKRWIKTQPGKTICLGHCTRMTLFSKSEWNRLVEEVADLPVYFIGLPTSDLFMQGRPEAANSSTQELAAWHGVPRATLHVPAMLDRFLNAAIGVNNLGNPFTPFGSADPLRLAQWGVGIYQASTAEAAESLFRCVSSGAKRAMGLYNIDEPEDVLFAARKADLIAFGPKDTTSKFVRRRQTIAEVVWDPPPESDRTVIYRGKIVNV